MAPKLELLPTEILETIANFCVEEPDDRLFNLRATCREIEAGPSACAVSAANPYGCLVTAISALDIAKCTGTHLPYFLLRCPNSPPPRPDQFQGSGQLIPWNCNGVAKYAWRHLHVHGSIQRIGWRHYVRGTEHRRKRKCMCKNKSKFRYRPSPHVHTPVPRIF